jgi:hypothetical protein
MASVHHGDPIRAMLASIEASLCPPGDLIHPDSIEWQIFEAMRAEAMQLRLGDDVARGDHDDCPRDCGRCGQVLGPDDAYQCASCIGNGGVS